MLMKSHTYIYSIHVCHETTDLTTTEWDKYNEAIFKNLLTENQKPSTHVWLAALQCKKKAKDDLYWSKSNFTPVLEICVF